MAAAVEEFGRVDAVLNVAGVADGCPLADLTMEIYDRLMDVDLRGVMLGMKHGIRTMLTTGGGSIVNWSSVGGLNGSAYTSVYKAAKHGIIGASKSAAIEYGTEGIRVNTICPGFILTEIMAVGAEDFMPDIAAKAALNRAGLASRGGRGRAPFWPPIGPPSSPVRSSRWTEVGRRSWRSWMDAVPTAEASDTGSPGTTRSTLRRHPAPRTGRRDTGADPRRRLRAAPPHLRPGLEEADGPGCRRTGRRQRANRLPLLRERTGTPRRGDAPERAGRRHRSGAACNSRTSPRWQPRSSTMSRQYSREPRPPLDPTLVDAKDRQREALLGAIAATDRAMLRGGPDAWWPPYSTSSGVSPPTSAWSSTGRSITERAVQGIAWVIGLVEQAVRDGRGPG